MFEGNGRGTRLLKRHLSKGKYLKLLFLDGYCLPTLALRTSLKNFELKNVG